MLKTLNRTMFHRLFSFQTRRRNTQRTDEKREMAKEEIHEPKMFKQQYSHTLIALFLSYCFERHRIVG